MLILQTARFADVLPHIDDTTWCLIDIDNTLYEAKDALSHANWVYAELEKRLQKGQTKEQALNEFHPEWVKRQETAEVKSIEPDFISKLKELQQRRIIIMGLTHRPVTVANATIRQVNSLNFNFAPSAPYQETLIVPAPYPTLYRDGILFIGDLNCKGKVFAKYLSLIKRIPKKIVFIDDKKQNITDFEQVFLESEIEYLGVHYTAINATALR